MKMTTVLFATALSLACSARSAPAAAPGAIDQLLAGKVSRIELCGYGDGHTSKGVPNEKALRAACDEGRDSFVVAVYGLAVSDLERAVKAALKSAQRLDGAGYAGLPCFAVVTVVLDNGKSFKFAWMTTDELRFDDSRVMPAERGWIDSLPTRVCQLLGCVLPDTPPRR